MHIWNFLKKNWDIILTMLIAAAIAILSFFQSVEPQVVSAAILSVLFLIACSLLVNRETNSRLQSTTEKILERMRTPPIEDVLVPYKTWMDDIEASLASAKEVWILSRTCTRLWEDYQVQLQGILKNKGAIRLLLVNPHNGASEMIANSTEMDRRLEINGIFLKQMPTDYNNRLVQLRAQVEDFVGYISNVSEQIGNEHLALRMIEYLPAYTLVIINGGSEKGKIFVALGTFRSNSRSRPMFSLCKLRDKRLFTLYYEEFKAMWDAAHLMG
jgi:hypothetical protein